MGTVAQWLNASAVRALRFPFLERLGGLRTAFTSRHGGVTEGPRGSLNLSYSVGDEPHRVAENRRRALALVGLPPERAVVAGLVHGVRVARIDGPLPDTGPGAAAGDRSGLVPGVDALVTATPGLALVVTTADCVPIFLFDPRRRAVALVHAGWRGTARGAAGHAVRALAAEYGSRPEDLWAVVGPSIGPCCYEVDEPVVAAFEEGQDGAVTAGPGSWLRRGTSPGRWRLDLWAANRDQVIGFGVPAEQVQVAGICTACEAADFFSHRAQRGQAGRQAAILVLDEEGCRS